MKGIYVIHLPEMEEDIYKIGCSKDLDLRLKKISNDTLRLNSIEILYTKEFEDFRMAEKEIHKLLSEYRINPNKEFFKCKLDIILNVIDNLVVPKRKEKRIKEIIYPEISEEQIESDIKYYSYYQRYNNIKNILEQHIQKDILPDAIDLYIDLLYINTCAREESCNIDKYRDLYKNLLTLIITRTVYTYEEFKQKVFDKYK